MNLDEGRALQLFSTRDRPPLRESGFTRDMGNAQKVVLLSTESDPLPRTVLLE